MDEAKPAVMAEVTIPKVPLVSLMRDGKVADLDFVDGSLVWTGTMNVAESAQMFATELQPFFERMGFGAHQSRPLGVERETLEQVAEWLRKRGDECMAAAKECDPLIVAGAYLHGAANDIVDELTLTDASDEGREAVRRWKAALQDIADAEPIPNDAVAFVWCRDVASVALRAVPPSDSSGDSA